MSDPHPHSARFDEARSVFNGEFPPGYIETMKHIAARMEAAEAKLAAVRALHAQDPDRRDRSVCVECTRWLNANARIDSDATVVWPCRTAKLVLEPKRPQE